LSQNELTGIYNRRFRSASAAGTSKSRSNAWKALYKKVLQKHVLARMTVLDLGSGPGYFINQVSAERKIAVDLDENNQNFVGSDVEFRCNKAQNLDFAESNSVDLVFSSNLFEHLGSSEALLLTLKEVHRVLKKQNSKLIVLMPNIRYAKWDFFNFIDHNLPLNETSLKEALELSNFEVVESHKRFFPYSANNIQVAAPLFLIKIYLSLPSRLRPAAKQMYFVAKPINHTL